MANWTLTGGLGSGKSIIAAGKLVDHMLAGLPCAGNIDFYPERILPSANKNIYLRLPDFPSSSDLWNLGQASTSKLEKTFGLLVLDELAVFLNSRDWAGKGREEFIKYLRHVRKQHWHTLFITQDIESLDKQARIALIEHKAVCSRTDRLPIPLIGWLLKMFGIARMLPRVHIAIVKYGTSQHAKKVDTWTYHGSSLFNAYDTDQIFTDAEERLLNPVLYPAFVRHVMPFSNPVLISDGFKSVVPTSSGAFSTLSAWHLVGRYQNFWDRNKHIFYVFGFLAFVFYAIFFYFFAPKPLIVSPSAVVPVVSSFYSDVVQTDIFVLSYFTAADGFHHLKFNDGTYAKSFTMRIIDLKRIKFEVDNKWYVYTL